MLLGFKDHQEEVFSYSAWAATTPCILGNDSFKIKKNRNPTSGKWPTRFGKGEFILPISILIHEIFSSMHNCFRVLSI